MPTKTTICSALPVIAALAAVFCPSWATAQTLTLTVPYRGAASMQPASTTIEFDASALAGATIGVTSPGGALVSVAVPASPCVGLACVATGTATNLDDIVVRRISGTNRAQLQLTYLAAYPANFCAYAGPLVSRAYDVTLTGFTFGGGTNGYRMTSFMAPSNESCDIPYARVPGPRPTLAGAVTRLGRLPLNVVLVLDKSPSMGWTIPGSADIRWAALKGAAQLFTNVWDVIGAPPAPATVSSEGHAEDRLGVIFFGGTAVESPLDGVNFFKSRAALATPWGPPVATALAPVPGFIGGTSIGAGVTNGRSKLDTVDLVQGDTAILLFTDGEQNTPPCIIHQGETLSPTTKPYPNQPPGTTYLDQCTVAANINAPLTLNGARLAQNVLPRGPIFTIGLGEGGTAASAQLLDRIAQETAGQSRYPLTSAALSQTFIDTLVDNLKGGTVSDLESASGTVPAAAVAGTPLTVAIDPSITRAVFVLSWTGIGREVQLEVKRPDGTVVTPSAGEGSPNSRVVAVNLPADGPAGSWQARLVRQTGTTGPLDYQLSAIGVESRLSARITQSPQVGTGRPVKIAAEVGWDDGGLADLPAGAIVAVIERPNENLGNLLRLPLTGDPAPAQEDASPLMVKFHRLAETPGFLDRIEPRPLSQKVPLVSVGNGRYEGTFDAATVGGHYRIRIDFDWTDTRTGAIPIRRHHPAERPVPVLPSAAGTLVTVTRDIRAGTAVIVITPRDRFGNYVGPGFEDQFNVRVNGAPAGKVSDQNLTGSYTVHLTGLGPNDDPGVKIDYGGQPLRDAPLSQLGGGGGGAGQYRLFIDIGPNFPQGNFGNAVDGRVSVNGGLEVFVMPATSVEAIVGYHAFDDGSSANPHIWQVSGNVKQYFGPGPLRGFVNGGVGIYRFDPGSVNKAGFNAGGGVIYDVTPRVSVEGVYNLHTINTPGSATRFSTLQGGVRIRFP